MEAEIARLEWLWEREVSRPTGPSGGPSGSPSGGPSGNLASDPSGAVATASAAVPSPGEALMAALLDPEAINAMDLFDRLQLVAVLGVCATAGSMSEAGRALFQASRQARAVVNDADRLRKYLLRVGLSWDRIAAAR